ncbi:unnamed protein product [Linum tenue]|uniref:Uncharacterized protein n=1 Tax=Linum tenue TaxID=586396 RepID=A0AAV0NAI1_9ROSI|nr:unnamed protein product [Linum tenue]
MALVKAAACFLFCLVILHPYVSTVVARTISPATMAPAPSPIIIIADTSPASEAELAPLAPEEFLTIISAVAPATPPATFAPAEPPIIITAAEDAPEAPVPDAALPPAIDSYA